jgi:signal transduction histidine kinase
MTMLRHTIRFRITAVAVVLSAVVLVGVSVLMTMMLRAQLTDNLDEGLNQRADTIAAVVVTDGVASLPSGDEDLLVQVVDRTGSVLGASTSLRGAAAIASLNPGLRTVDNIPGRAEAFRVLVRQIDSGPRALTLIVGINRDDVTNPVSILSRLLLAAVPAVIVLLGALTWWLTGRTLRPVEKIRLELTEITGTNLGRRVVEPATGDEVDRLAHTMNETLDRLEDSIRRQQRFVSDASHELRGPLTRIRSELEVDLATDEPNDASATKRSVLRETIDLQHLVDDLLQLARSDGALAEMTFEPIDLDDIVLREARRLRERGRVTVVSRDVTAAQTYGDSRQLTRAIRNLFDNAERHAASTVSVHLSEVDGHVRLTVDDDGNGVPVEDRHTIFERFTRLDEARTRDGGGAGLGLAIVRDIVQRHNGTVALDDGPSTRFVISLPLVP